MWEHMGNLARDRGISFAPPPEAKAAGSACWVHRARLQVGRMLIGGTLSLPQGVLHGAEVQWGQTLVAPQVGVSLVLQQQLDAVGVPPQAGFVQGPLSPQRQVGVGPSAEEMAQAGGVTPAGDEAQRGGQLPLVLQRPQPCGVEGAGLMPRADLLGSPAPHPPASLVNKEDEDVAFSIFLLAPWQL